MTNIRPDALDEELERILQLGSGMRPLTQQSEAMRPAQAPVWPWQVPQVPSYTSDRSPSFIAAR
jgi:hypothetical protein